MPAEPAEPALPPVDLTTLDEQTRSALEGLPPLNVFRTVANATSAVRPWLAYGGVLLTGLELDPVDRELVILAVADTVGSTYEWTQHVVVGGWAGVSDDQIAAVRSGDTAPFSEDQQAVLALTRAVAAGGPGAGRTETAALVARRGPRAAAEVLLVAGHYVGIARFIEAAGFAVDDALDPDAVAGSAEKLGQS